MLHPRNQPFPEHLLDFSILVVEDCAATNKIINKLLLADGFKNIHAVNSGKDAISYIESTVKLPDVILADWLMPEIDGLQLLEYIRCAGSHCIFIMVTVLDHQDDVMLAKAHHVDGYIVKPVTRRKLIEEIEMSVSRLSIAHD
ncbi:response regulator [Paramagnetospirillum kuznetsovii]|uniref:Response regulator n=1 Tax=Paramagnetospirillum kuznetsovii TaxID=2053833 RepID=A0A364P3U6_9PROT|nr:response regulator [Paramagnetospirillum kuznetsovii]RAU23971.1 response regulator [Paramagnetospirillum kuznetsovii]